MLIQGQNCRLTRRGEGRIHLEHPIEEVTILLDHALQAAYLPPDAAQAMEQWLPFRRFPV